MSEEITSLEDLAAVSAGADTVAEVAAPPIKIAQLIAAAL